MKQCIKRIGIGMAQSIISLLGLPIIVMMSSCSTREKSWDMAPTTPSEVVLLCGNPGVGKSTLLNSIFQKEIFLSGVSIGSGLTQAKQTHIYKNRLYMDTPGLSDVSLRKQAAKEIEKALKGDKNYKIVFVATLESGRIRPADLETINTICEAIQAPFEYGIIFNKVSQEVLESCNQNKQKLVAAYLPMLKKQPLSHLIIENDETIEEVDNVYLPRESKNRQALLNFIDNLPLNKIPAHQVATVQGETCDERVKQMEIQKREAAAAKQAAEERRREAEERARRAEAEQREADNRRREAEIRAQELAKFRGSVGGPSISVQVSVPCLVM